MAKKVVKANIFVNCGFCAATGRRDVVDQDGNHTGETEKCAQCGGRGGNDVGWIEIPVPIPIEAKEEP